ncbi:MAG: heparan-alpha-glucosaminide N-acetyltransferase domain-containing protein [Myxococcota bacterium]
MSDMQVSGLQDDATEKSKRIEAIDQARGVSVVLMVLVHTLWIHGTEATQIGWFGDVVHFVGRGTPMFLLAMGFSFILSRRQTMMASIGRGIALLGIAYLMNTLKFIVPIKVFGNMPETFIEAYGWHSPLDSGQLLYLIGTGDILQLAGLALIAMGLAKRFLPNAYSMAALAAATVILTPFVRGYRPGIVGLDYICDLFWGQEWNVYFPVFPWVSIIFFGMSLGMMYRETNDPGPVFRRMLPLGGILFVVGGVLCLFDYEFHVGDFFHLGPGGAVHLMGISAILFWFAHKISPWLAASRIGPLFKLASRWVTSLYVWHWVVICWAMGIFGYHELDALQVTLLYPVFLALSLGADAGFRFGVKSVRRLVRPPHPEPHASLS